MGRSIIGTRVWSIALLLCLALAAGCDKGEEKQEEEKKVESSALLDPAKANETAPDSYRVRFTTTKGDFTLEVTRDLAPLGADRFYNLVKIGYFKDVAFFRIVDEFVAQFGMHGDPKVGAVWNEARIPDDPVKGSNMRGTITYAMAGPNTRSNQFFINLDDFNVSLDEKGFAQFGEIVEGMETIDALHKDYGDGPPRGRGPDQARIAEEGNAYLKDKFPELDYILDAELIE